MVTDFEELNIVVAGVGGQGSILLSHILGNAAIREGYKVRVAETYGASIRGGAVLGQIRIGPTVLGPLISEDNADILVGLEPIESLRVGVKYLAPRAIATINTRPVAPMSVNIGKAVYPSLEEIVESLEKLCKRVMPIDATKLAEQSGSSRTLNIVMLGALAATGKLPMSSGTLKHVVQEHVPKGTQKMNLRAYELGFKAIQRVTT